MREKTENDKSVLKNEDKESKIKKRKGKKNMEINLNKYILIYIILLLTGCDDNPVANNVWECESDFEMSLTSSDLVIDENGYYHIEWLEGYNQTFASLEAITNTGGYNRIYWSCDSGIQYEDNFVSCINPVSYTNDGVAKQIMGVWEEMIGDTLNINAGFEDWCYIQHTQSIKVIVDNLD